VARGVDVDDVTPFAGRDSEAASLPDREPRHAAVAEGNLLFVRDGVLLAVPFDEKALRVTGAPVAVADGVDYHRYRLNGLFSAADSGVLAFQTGEEIRTSRLAWYDRSGRELGTFAEPDDYGGLRLSPDGSRCAVEIRNAKTGSIDLWVVDIASGMRTRITSGGPINDAPNWSPDGRRILFSSNRSGHWDLYLTDASGLGTPEVALATDRDKVPTDWSLDGKSIVFSRSGDPGGNRWDVWTASLQGNVRPLVETPFNEGESRLSPDGTLLAFSSEASGQREIYVRTLNAPEREWRVSPKGGTQPIWRRNGRELFYVDASGFLMAVPVSPRGFDASGPAQLFDSSLISSASDIPIYDVSADGGRFLMNVRIGGRSTAPITILTGWTGVGKN
jgi:Tol biopolymer transport system component